MKALLLIALLAVAGCASTPHRAPAASSGSTRPTAELSDQAADHALKMLGKPYRYGGASPAGFDCSGLVLYSYKSPNDSIWQLAVHMFDFCSLTRRQRINLRNRTERLRS